MYRLLYAIQHFQPTICLLPRLFTWQAALFFVVFVAVMLLQVRSEEKRLHRDFGDEYAAYCRRTGRFTPKSFSA